jgi:hypothetical protein
MTPSSEASSGAVTQEFPDILLNTIILLLLLLLLLVGWD